MTVGGRRTVVVPPELGFGSSPAAGPYAIVPAGAAPQLPPPLLPLLVPHTLQMQLPPFRAQCVPARPCSCRRLTPPLPPNHAATLCPRLACAL